MAKIETVRALSVKQPWATDLINGEKKVEYRVWPIKELGPLLIVSSKNPRFKGRLPLGCALGFVEVVSCKWSKKDRCFHWNVKNPMPLAKPVELKGKLGIYDVSITQELKEISSKYREFCALYGKPRSYAVPKKPTGSYDEPDIEVDKRPQIAKDLRAALKELPVVEQSIVDFQNRVGAIHPFAGRIVAEALDNFRYDMGAIQDEIDELTAQKE